MTPQDAKFVIEKDSALAVKLAQVALRHGNDMWKTLLKEGLLGCIRSATGARRDLMDSLIRTPNTDNAVFMLKAILDDMKPKQRESLFSNVRQSSVITLDWLDWAKEKMGEDGKYRLDPESKAHLKALLDVVKSYGVDINPPFKATGNRNQLYESSVVRETVSRVIHMGDDSINKPVAVERLDFMLEMGAKVDIPTKAMVLEGFNARDLLKTVKWFDEKGIVSPPDWLEAKDHKYASAQSVALLQGHLALSAIEQMGARKPQSKVDP
jgi:hypothetical protein